MVAISIQPHAERAQRALHRIKNGVPRAMAPAINRSLEKGRTTVKREIRKVYLIKAKDIPLRLVRASYARLAGEIRIQQGMLPLGKFEVKPRGVQRRKKNTILHVRVKRSGGGPLPHAFNVFAGGYLGPYQRTGKERLPIRKLMTIGAPIMASQPEVGPNVNRDMGDTLAKRVDHEIKRVMAANEGK
jgi:hypothetical protein